MTRQQICVGGKYGTTVVQQLKAIHAEIAGLAKELNMPLFKRRPDTNVATELTESRTFLEKLRGVKAAGYKTPADASKLAPPSAKPAPPPPTAVELWAQYAKLDVTEKRAFYVANKAVMDA